MSAEKILAKLDIFYELYDKMNYIYKFSNDGIIEKFLFFKSSLIFIIC